MQHDLVSCHAHAYMNACVHINEHTNTTCHLSAFMCSAAARHDYIPCSPRRPHGSSVCVFPSQKGAPVRILSKEAFTERDQNHGFVNNRQR